MNCSDVNGFLEAAYDIIAARGRIDKCADVIEEWLHGDENKTIVFDGIAIPSLRRLAKELHEEGIIKLDDDVKKAIEKLIASANEQIERIKQTGDIEEQRLLNIEDIILSTKGKSYQEVTFKAQSDIKIDEVFTLPANLTYVVGRNQVRITYDGVFLSKTYWKEVGALDSVSNKVQFLTNFKQGQEITVWIGSLYEDVEGAARAESAANRAEAAAERAEGDTPLFTTYVENLGKTPPAGLPEGGIVIYKNYIGG